MKTNFTSTAKTFLAIVFIIAASHSFANNTTPFASAVTSTSGNLKVAVVNNNLVMNWNLPVDADVNYCEIQGSKDGKTFTTIGYVMGPEPVKDATSYIFKQTLSKIKPGKTYFRVLIVGANEKAVSSETVKLGN
jgi:hypothetical protein